MNKLRTIFIINLSHAKFVMGEKYGSYFTNRLWNCQPYEELWKISHISISLKFLVIGIKTNDMSNACDDHTS
jgi:hypothetical protein